MLSCYILIYIGSFSPAYIIWIDILQNISRSGLKVCANKPIKAGVTLNSDPVEKWLPGSIFNGLRVDFQR